MILGNQTCDVVTSGDHLIKLSPCDLFINPLKVNFQWMPRTLSKSTWPWPKNVWLWLMTKMPWSKITNQIPRKTWHSFTRCTQLRVSSNLMVFGHLHGIQMSCYAMTHVIFIGKLKINKLKNIMRRDDKFFILCVLCAT